MLQAASLFNQLLQHFPRTEFASLAATDLLHLEGAPSGIVSGVVSIRAAAGRGRAVRRCPTMRQRTGGNLISPARSSISSSPRHTTSRNPPLACFHPSASHNSL